MDSRVQRLKIAWRVFMIANFGLGAYIFAMAKLKEGSSKSVKQVEAPLPAPAITSAPTPTVEVSEEPEMIAATPIAELMKVREPISEDEQREIFKWILDEKRKVKPRNKDEKKKIDEEKSILKQFIRSDSVPPL